MEVVIVFLIVGTIIYCIYWSCIGIGIAFSYMADKIDDLYYAVTPLFYFLGQNIYALAGLFCFGLAVFIFVYYRPHPAEKYLNSYKKGRIQRNEAIALISETMYNPIRDKIPTPYQSKTMQKRLNALRKRIMTESGFINELDQYIKRKDL